MRDFINLSRYAGMREDLVQAGGGNTSAKVSQTEMLVKASGFQLADVGPHGGWCRVDYRRIADYCARDGAEASQEAERRLLADCLLEGSRPSIETFLHAATQKYTLHTHPTVVNALAATDVGWQTLHGLFPDALFVGYATPGIRLAAAYFAAVREVGTVPALIFLRNHGLVVSGGSGGFVQEQTESVLSSIERHLGLDMGRFHAATAIYGAMQGIPAQEGRIACLSQHRSVIAGAEAFGAGLWDWQFCPDCIVYCGKQPLVLGGTFSQADFAAHAERYGAPVIVSHRGSVYIIADSVRKAREIESVLAFSAEVALANRGGRLNLLPPEEQDFLLGWDAETYRRNAR